MRSRDEVIRALTDPGIIAVIRAGSVAEAVSLSHALREGGVRALEITTTTPDYLLAIARVAAELGDLACVGVGTVLDEATARTAMEAGAEFVVSPVGSREVLAAAREMGRPVMLGAYTPTEAQAVHEAGADFVKLFPAEGLGPAYVKALRAPLPHLRIVPTGGIELGNVAEFFKAGAAAVGVGSSLMRPDLVGRRDWAGLSALAREFVARGAGR